MRGPEQDRGGKDCSPSIDHSNAVLHEQDGMIAHRHLSCRTVACIAVSRDKHLTARSSPTLSQSDAYSNGCRWCAASGPLMERKASVARLVKETSYAEAVHRKFLSHCAETAKLDALSRCRALNQYLETSVSFSWIHAPLVNLRLEQASVYRACGNPYPQTYWRQGSLGMSTYATCSAKCQKIVELMTVAHIIIRDLIKAVVCSALAARLPMADEWRTACVGSSLVIERTSRSPTTGRSV